MCFVITENHLGKAKSLSSMLSPDAARRLPYTDNTDRRARKNTENANIRNLFSDREKVALFVKIWKSCLHCDSRDFFFVLATFWKVFVYRKLNKVHFVLDVRLLTPLYYEYIGPSMYEL
jgi:hypothetical protein